MQTEFTTHKPGSFCWVDMMTTDTKAAKNFYNDIFGWQFQDVPVDEKGNIYTFLSLNGKPVAAMGEMNEDQKKAGFPPAWINYVCVTDASEKVKKAVELGATVVVPDMDAMEEGRFALLADPEGAIFGLWQPKNYQGAALKNTPGSVCWVEHNGHGNEKVVPFYENLFGWTSKTETSDKGMVYTSFYIGEEWAGDRFVLPQGMEEVPANWLTYFGTDNIDTLLEKCRSYNAQILADKMLIEGMGYFAVIQDPQGAVFGVVEFKM
jgi:predicted enzyme related to lactoylglutathione lyase